MVLPQILAMVPLQNRTMELLPMMDMEHLEMNTTTLPMMAMAPLLKTDTEHLPMTDTEHLPMMDTEHPPKMDMVPQLMTDMELLQKHLPQNMVHPQILHMARKFFQRNVTF